jgi:hypothetical protein
LTGVAAMQYEVDNAQATAGSAGALTKDGGRDTYRKVDPEMAEQEAVQRSVC